MSSMIDDIASSYDDMPYVSSPFQQTTPEHLRAVAHLFGLRIPAPQHARVLELGCAAGGNLIPFAVRHPDAEVVGIDLSRVQVEAGQRAIAAMKLTNLRLIHGSIAEIGKELGQFDYIICHGVYSWVPDEVREAILRVSRQQLAPDGVAYISYNVYPGWKAKEIVRDAMLLRGSPRGTAHEKLAYARGMVDFMHEMAAEGSVLKRVMDDNIDTVRNGDPHYLMHEFMELCNAPCYFRDFSAAARRHDLAYLSESIVSTMFASNYGAHVAEPVLRECEGQQEVLEQLLDFLSNRTFRQTLLVHADRAENIRYGLDRTRIALLHVAGQFEPLDSQEESWRSPNHADVHTRSELERQVIRQLNAAWPATVPVAELGKSASGQGRLPKEARQSVLDLVEQMIIRNQVRYRLDPVTPAREAGTHPRTSPAFRALLHEQLTSQAPISLFNLWHESMHRLGPVEQVLIPLTDGHHTVDELVEALKAAAMRGELAFHVNDVALEKPQEIAEAARDHTRRVLAWMANTALLEPSTE